METSFQTPYLQQKIFYKYPMQYIHNYICSWQLLVSCFVGVAYRLQDNHLTYSADSNIFNTFG